MVLVKRPKSVVYTLISRIVINYATRLTFHVKVF